MGFLLAALSTAASIIWTYAFHTLDSRLRGHTWAGSLAKGGVLSTILCLPWLLWESMAYLVPLVPGFLTILILVTILYRVVRL